MPETSSLPALVQLTAVRKSYFSNRVETPVLHGIDFTMQRGDFVAIMGQSGSGKSTLMNILGCLDTPTSGQHRLAGHTVNTLSRAELAGLRNRTIGFVFQSFNLLKRMSVLDNVALPLLYARVSRAEARRRAQLQLAKVGLAEFAQRQPNQLSGGQQQRVAIARAIAAEPAVVLADEPTANVDRATADKLLSLMETLNRERQVTFIFSTHDPRVMERARRVVHMAGGRVERDERKTL